MTGIELKGNNVEVAFKVKTASKFGDQTPGQDQGQDPARGDVPRAGAEGLGSAVQELHDPGSRTTSAYDVVEAFSGLAERAQKINLDQLADSLNTLAARPRHPRRVPGHPDGLSRLSANVAPQPADR